MLWENPNYLVDCTISREKQGCAGKKSLGGRDFFQGPPAPTHEIFFWVGA